MRTLQSVFDLFKTAREQGLSKSDQAESRNRFGLNKLTSLPKEPLWKKFLEKFDEPIIKILLAASLLKIIVDLFSHSPLLGGISLLVLVVSVALAYIVRLADWVPTGLFAFAAALFTVSVVIGDPSIEGLAVMVAVALATGVSFLSEYRSDQEFEKLNSQKDAVRVKVKRDGQQQTLLLEDVLVGDLVLLETGDEIPADGRVVVANELQIDQSLMTGESEAVRKQVMPDTDESDGPDKPACVYRGTQVLDGIGEMIVTNVGDDTMIGQIARRLSGVVEVEEASTPTDRTNIDRVQKKLTISKEQTPLQEKLAVLAGIISKIGYLAALLIFIALFLRGIFFSDPVEMFWPSNGEETIRVANHLLSYFVYMVIVIVVAVPEGLPMSVTVSLALAMRKMTRANSLVRQLVACETIGSATVICTDKTGTLTQNKMQVERLGLLGQTFDTEAQEFTPSDATRFDDMSMSPTDAIALNAAVNSTATLESKEEKTVVVGNSTEGALLLWLRDAGHSYSAWRQHYPPQFRVAFSSETKRMATVVALPTGTVQFLKGAPEVLLARCQFVKTTEGQIRTMTESDRQQILDQLRDAAELAMRTLGFAHSMLPNDWPTDPEGMSARKGELEVEWVFDGFAAIRDPLRHDVKDAVKQCRDAGIEVKMITGDNPLTAKAIAQEVGLLDDPNAILLTSDEFNSLSDEELKEKLPTLRVLARAKPLDKFRIVKLLQEQQHVVAMTGDGTNDAPSLKKADVGLAMGIAGTEVAKEASKIVLLDDSFSTIVKAVHWGRSLYENIQRFIQFQLTINFSALLIAFLGPFFGLKPPFTVLQLLWINVIMDTFAAIALCSEPPRPGLMKMKPKKRNERIVSVGMFRTIFITGMFYVVVMMGLLKGMEWFGWFAGTGAISEVFPELTIHQVTLFFTVYVFFQVWNQINCRSLTPDVPGWKGLFGNRLFLMIASLTVLGQWLIVQFGGVIFAVEPLAWNEWLVIAVSTFSVIIFAELVRAIQRWRMASE